MTPEHREAQRRIKEAAHHWRGLVPPDVVLKHIFIEGSVDTESPDVLCETKTAWEYHQATMRWSLPNCAGITVEEIGGTFVHECIHIYLGAIEAHLRSDNDTPWNAICEHSVEAIAQAIVRLAE